MRIFNSLYKNPVLFTLLWSGLDLPIKVKAFIVVREIPYFYRGADKSLARSTSRSILFDGENISFDVSLVIYINSTSIPPIMIINRIYETQNLLSL